MQICANDFTQSVAADCREFDFTLEFSNLFLIAIPGLVLLILAIFRCATSVKAENILKRWTAWPLWQRATFCVKMASALACVGVYAASLAIWISDATINHWSSRFAQASGLSAAIALALWVYLEHTRSLQSNILVSIYLFGKAFADVTLVRSYYLAGLGSSGPGITAILSLAFTLMLLIAENQSKASIIDRKNSGKPLPIEATATPFSRLLFVWLDPLLWRGFKQPLNMATLGDLDPRLASDVLYERAEANWKHYKASGKSRPLARTILATFRADLAKPVVPCLVYTLAQVTQPVLVKEILSFLSSFQNGTDNHEPDEWGWGLAVAYLLVFSLYSIAYAQFYLEVNRNMAVIRGFLIEAIYRKALVVHVRVAAEVGSGAATSLMSIDAERIAKQVLAVHQMYSAAILVALGFYIVYSVVGIVFVATLVTALLCLIAIPLAARGLGTLQGRLSGLTDKRIRLMSSVLHGIKQVKLSAYEDAVLEKVGILREAELKAFWIYWFRLLLVSAITNLLSNAMTAATIVTYFLLARAQELTFSITQLFTTLSVITIISTPLLFVGQNWSQILTALASLKRIEAFLLREERQTPEVHAGNASDIADMRNVSLSQGGEIVLRDISVQIPAGRLTMVIGEVGSGKSTLLNALLGEVDIQGGQFKLPDAERIGCATQESWLQGDMSIRDNILFHEEYDSDWYREVILACALDKDFQLMDKGDRRKAQGLSGGQAQRICLARAIYSKVDTYILDDCFSALDATTEAHVFTTLFGFSGLLSGKTVVLGTNGIHRLQFADFIITVGGGKILEKGTYADLLAQGQYTQKLVDRFGSGVAKTKAKAKEQTQSVALNGGASLASSEPEDLIALEIAAQRWKGNPTWAFTKAVGLWISLPAFVAYASSFSLFALTSLYIEIWVSSNPLSLQYFGGYLGLELFYVVCFFGAVYTMYLFWAPRGTRELHRRLVTAVLATDISFFEKTPIGVILNRFSEDTNAVDQTYPNHFANFLSSISLTLTSLGLVAAASYYTLPVMVIAAISCISCQRFYIRSSRELRKLSLASKSPLYSTFAATIDPIGLQIIRSFKAADYLAMMNTDHATTSQAPTYLMNVVKRWLSLVLDLNVAAINASLCFLAVAERNSRNGAIFAVALQQGISLTTWLNLTIMSYSELEIEETSVARVIQFSHLPKEDSGRIVAETDDDETAKEQFEETDLPLKATASEEFATGSISFNNVTLRYDDAETPALKSLSFSIRNGQRIGFVGRTGSGKSTTLAALLRMHEIDDDGGAIFIDSKSIKTVSRHALRSQISIIPQDPLLLDMTLRDNLDMYNRHSDDAIWAALEDCRAKDFVRNLEGQLDFPVSGVSTFSRGQRQLLALARAVLQPRMIICLDEATSSLDVATDHAIQQTIRKAFAGSTILCVAHRTHTVMDYDIVCVLEAGRVVEWESPSLLLQDEGGHFARLAKEQGAAAVGKIEQA